MSAKNQLLVERVLLSIDFTKSCWIWNKSLFKDGYGQIKINGKNKKSHRVSYELFIGPIPESMIVCHLCANPKCIRPSHLFIGTNNDNIKDRTPKRRSAWGARHPKVKATKEQVIKARELHLKGMSYLQISKSTGLHYRNIALIVKYRTWKYIDDDTRT